MEHVKEKAVRKVKPEDCPIGLDKVHCQNCYFWRDGKCDYEEVVKKGRRAKGGEFSGSKGFCSN